MSTKDVFAKYKSVITDPNKGNRRNQISEEDRVILLKNHQNQVYKLAWQYETVIKSNPDVYSDCCLQFSDLVQ